MKIIKADVDDGIIFNTIEDVDTGITIGITSVLRLPTGNLNNILIDFNFINKSLPEKLKILANFNINEKRCIEVPLEKVTIGEKTFENACYIPAEVFEEPCYFMLGLYGFALEGEDEIKQRISLIPLKNIVVKGSYDPNANESIVPTPTAFEVYFNKIDTLTDEVEKLKTDAENEIQDLQTNLENKIDDELGKRISYYRKYEAVYKTTATNTTEIDISIPEFNKTTLLLVDINGLDLIETEDYTIDYENRKITLANPLEVIGTKVHFICLKTSTSQAETYDLLKGADGLGVPKGGTTGQILAKKSNADNDTEWVDQINDTIINGVKLAVLQAENPVGHIRMETTNVNPATYLGFGTWELWGSGRVPVGVDTTQTEFSTVEKTGGEKEHTLTIDEMPKHSHAPQNNSAVMASSGSGDINQTSGSRTYEILQIGSTGGSQPHNNLQPYITCYMWKRTA